MESNGCRAKKLMTTLILRLTFDFHSSEPVRDQMNRMQAVVRFVNDYRVGKIFDRDILRIVVKLDGKELVVVDSDWRFSYSWRLERLLIRVLSSENVSLDQS